MIIQSNEFHRNWYEQILKAETILMADVGRNINNSTTGYE